MMFTPVLASRCGNHAVVGVSAVTGIRAVEEVLLSTIFVTIMHEFGIVKVTYGLQNNFFRYITVPTKILTSFRGIAKQQLTNLSLDVINFGFFQINATKKPLALSPVSFLRTKTETPSANI
jgi:hypothetical protein